MLHPRRGVRVGVFCVLIALLALCGCGSKRVAAPSIGLPPAPLAAAQSAPEENRFVLPEDDGKPLSAAEEKAFFSEGDFDRRLTRAQLGDVLRHFKQLVHRERDTVEESVARARLYLPMIRGVLGENSLPADLAYLPFVESNYGVLVLSRSGALGMWQFIPSSASYYGLKRDSWTDERRDPAASTRVAALYFSRLRDFFDGDWHLAISAYNAGEGKIRRGLDATGAKTFFELRDRDGQITDPKLKMSAENRQYLPKFLAVCKIMRNLRLLGFEPVEAKAAPLMGSLLVKPGVNLSQLAARAGMSWDTFLLYNSYFLRRYSPPDRTTTVLVPLCRQKQVTAWLKQTKGTTAYAAWRPYTVTWRDSCRKVAQRHNTSVRELTRVNQLEGKKFRAGAVMLVPPVRAKAVAAAKTPRVQAQPDSATEQARALAARLTGRSGASKSGASTPAAQAPGKRPATYTVRPGDSMWSIARKFDIPPKNLLAANGMTASTARVRPGDVITVRR